MSELDLLSLDRIFESSQSLDRSSLLPILISAQKEYGYLPEPVLAEIAQNLKIPLVEIFGVIEFYSMLYKEQVGSKIIRVCTDPSCSLAGGEDIFKVLKTLKETGSENGNETQAFHLERAPCLGLCDQAPALLSNDKAYGHLNREELIKVLIGDDGSSLTVVNGSPRILTSNCGKGYPTFILEYLNGGGFTAFEKALSISPNEIIQEVKNSGLVGRGGAAFPAGLKWEGAALAQGEIKYVVCNADESEPGTFKDRILLEEDPHRVLEGMLIAAYAVGCRKGFIYIRGEYQKAYEVINNAVHEAQENGYLGDNILNTQFSFDIEIRQGAGAYICGEETALFESIEGKRGFPRLKPPFPTTNGLFYKPTVINNVETLCNIPFIISEGATAFRQIGTDQSPGSKLFCLSGDIAKPGLYEAPLGVSLRHLVFDLADGMMDGKRLQAILIGGAAGVFVTPDQLDVSMSFEGLSEAGLALGSGAIIAFSTDRDLRDVLVRLGRFFAHESCGKCYPCQLGTQRQYEILQRISAGAVLPGDGKRLMDIGCTMRDASICGLGQTAGSAVLSALEKWPHLFGI